jgi:DNA-binding response OmpR family regulator
VPDRKKILLVDDSRTALVAEAALLSHTYEISTAEDGQEGLRKALDDRPDLILLDVLMPRMDGLTALRALRAHAQTEATPVILVSTLGELESLEAGYASGCSDYVTKPFDVTELLEKVRSCLGE